MAKSNFTGPEKRAFLRISARCDVKYTKLSKTFRPLAAIMAKARTEDICAGGIQFVARKKMPVKTVLEFRFRIPSTTKYASGLGEVVRVQRRPAGKTYNVGLKFLWVHRKDAELIDAYARKKRMEWILKKLLKR